MRVSDCKCSNGPSSNGPSSFSLPSPLPGQTRRQSVRWLPAFGPLVCVGGVSACALPRATRFPLQADAPAPVRHGTAPRYPPLPPPQVKGKGVMQTYTWAGPLLEDDSSLLRVLNLYL